MTFWDISLDPLLLWDTGIGNQTITNIMHTRIKKMKTLILNFLFMHLPSSDSQKKKDYGKNSVNIKCISFIFSLAKALLVFFIVHTATGFYVSNIFAPNHKGMPQLGKHVKISFLEHQIMTSRNIYGHWLTDYVFMGLNYQIEHHLFPNTPRNKFKKITPYVMEICRRRKLEFIQTGIIESNKIILSELRRIAASAA